MSIIPATAKGRNDPPRFNVAPTQDVGFVHQASDAREYKLSDGRWWLVPHWAKEIPKYPMFNARSETVREKSSFRDAIKSKRCLIPASGYYEWTKNPDGGKDPHFIHLPEQKPFMFAGLWAYNSHLDITSCTIITAPAVKQIAHLHHRMPVLLDSTRWNEWLSPDVDAVEACAMLEQNQGELLTSYPVSRTVNSSRTEGVDLISPI